MRRRRPSTDKGFDLSDVEAALRRVRPRARRPLFPSPASTHNSRTWACARASNGAQVCGSDWGLSRSWLFRRALLHPPSLYGFFFCPRPCTRVKGAQTVTCDPRHQFRRRTLVSRARIRCRVIARLPVLAAPTLVPTTAHSFSFLFAARTAAAAVASAHAADRALSENMRQLSAARGTVGPRAVPRKPARVQTRWFHR